MNRTVTVTRAEFELINALRKLDEMNDIMNEDREHLEDVVKERNDLKQEHRQLNNAMNEMREELERVRTIGDNLQAERVKHLSELHEYEKIIEKKDKKIENWQEGYKQKELKIVELKSQLAQLQSQTGGN